MSFRRQRRWRASLVAVAAAGVLALAGCGGTVSASGEGEDDPDATLRIMYGMTTSLDPADASESAQLTFATWPVYDRLIQVDTESTYQPMLATEWEFSEDGRALTLTLREGVTFSDGAPFDAAAVKANLDYALGRDKTALQQSLSSVESVEVSGEQVVIHLEHATTAILSALSSNLGGIMVSPKAIESGDLATRPVGTGAYVLESFKPGEQAVYTRRTDQGGIWDPKTGKVARVEISRIASADAKVNALKSGQIDLTTWAGDPNDYAGQPSVRTVPFEGVNNMTGMYFNTAVAPLDDPLVRQAVNHAIDREGVVAAFAPTSPARVQPWPSGLPGFDEERESAYPYDPEKAKELLAEAGHPDGVTIRGEFLTSPSSNLDKAAEAVQANLADVGIDIELRTMDILAQVTAYPAGKNPGQFAYMSLSSIDPKSWLDRLFTNPFWTPAGPDAEIVDLIAGLEDPSLSEADVAAGVGAAIDHATDQALFAPLWQGTGGLAVSDKVAGLDEIASVNGGVADLRNISMVR